MEHRLKLNHLYKKWFVKNRLVIVNENTFEEIFSFKLNLINVFVVLTIGVMTLIFLTTYIIAFTPLREYIPGYSSSELKREATELALKSDSLNIELQHSKAYIESVQKVLTGKLEYAKFDKDSITQKIPQATANEELNPSEEELKLRKKITAEETK